MADIIRTIKLGAVTVTIAHDYDPDPDTSWLDPHDDADRLAQIANGNVWFVGIVARVVVDGVEVGLSSIWGVESDSGADYFALMGREEGRQACQFARQWLDRRGLSKSA